MRRVRSTDSRCELVVRRILHRLGYRFRLHRRDLPGTPDIVFPTRKKVIFVHGCFWHRHPGCRKSSTPNTRTEYWVEKFAANQARDDRNIRELLAMEWHSLVIWECETGDAVELERRLVAFLGVPGRSAC